MEKKIRENEEKKTREFHDSIFILSEYEIEFISIEFVRAHIWLWRLQQRRRRRRR